MISFENIFENPIVVSILVLFLIIRLFEAHINRNNYSFLKYLGAEELIPKTMLLFYKAILVFLPLAAMETLVLPEYLHWQGIIYIGAGLFVIGNILKLWAIHSLGAYWVMSCMAFKGQKLLEKGPFRYLQNPEYTGRVIEGVGLLLLLQSYLITAIYIVFCLHTLKKIISIESRQVREMTSTKVKIENIRATTS